MSGVWRPICKSISGIDSDISKASNQSITSFELSASLPFRLFSCRPPIEERENLQRDRRQNMGTKEQKGGEHWRKSPLPHLPWQRRSEIEKRTARDVAYTRVGERQRTGAHNVEAAGPFHSLDLGGRQREGAGWGRELLGFVERGEIGERERGNYALRFFVFLSPFFILLYLKEKTLLGAERLPLFAGFFGLPHFKSFAIF